MPAASPPPVAIGSPPRCAIATLAPPPVDTSQPGWWANRVFYEAFVRSFFDSSGDGIGDLAGLTAKLDYLNDGNPGSSTDLGVTGLWLMPTFPSPSYHGYDVTDYRGVNPEYGSLRDLRTLVSEAHARGMAVILDLPLNHTSDQHPWFVESATPGSARQDWYVWADAPQGNNWHRLGDRFYYAAFGSTLPDLNLRNPDVTAELTSTALFWLKDVGVDGFRLDAAKHLIEDGATTEDTPETHAWWHDFRTAIEVDAPAALMLGEVFDTPRVSSSYVPDGLDMTFDFGLASSYVTGAGTGDGNALGRVLAFVNKLYPQGGFGAFLTNHDQERAASQIGDLARLKVAAALLLTGPGVPFIYYGEEIGMTGQKPDEQIRTPLRWDATAGSAGFTSGTPWEALSADAANVNVADESANPDSLLNWYRDLVALRSQNPVLSLGAYYSAVASSRNVVAELRRYANEAALVVGNLGDSDLTGVTLSLESGPLCGTPGATLALGSGQVTPPIVTPDGGFSDYAPLTTLPAHSVTVIALTQY
jgi:alpha-amylase